MKNNNRQNECEKYRQQVRAEILPRLAQEREKMKQAGKYPYEGKWRPLEEIKHLQLQTKGSERTIFCELIALFILIAGLTYGLYILMLRFLLPR